eukprot:6187605-Pleurochrysis_carterae.AAC.1
MAGKVPITTMTCCAGGVERGKEAALDWGQAKFAHMLQQADQFLHQSKEMRNPCPQMPIQSPRLHT